MTSKASMLYPARRPPLFLDAHMPRADLVHLNLMTVFPEWSSTRISRWLGVNSRTLQRWLSLGTGKIPDDEVPSDLQAKISSQAAIVSDIDLGGQLRAFTHNMLSKNHIDKEVYAAWLAFEYRDVLGREID